MNANRNRSRGLAVIVIVSCEVLGLGAIGLLLASDARAAGEVDSPPPITVETCGLRVVAPTSEGAGDLRAFNQFAGTTVALQVVRPSGGLISFDRDASRLEIFADDRGTNLLVKKGFMSPGFGAWTRISDDGRVAMLEVNGGALPSSGARQIDIKGNLVFKVATEKKTFQQKKVSLTAGTKIQAGPIAFTIKEVGKPGWGDEPVQITLEAKQEVDSLFSVRFLDDAGREIKSAAASSSRMKMFNSVVVEKSYRLAEKVDSLTIELTYWMDMQTVELPLDLSASVGLNN